MKFPKLIRYRCSQVVIYGERPSYPFYWIAYYTHGKRVMESSPIYTGALTKAEKKGRKLA